MEGMRWSGGGEKGIRNEEEKRREEADGGSSKVHAQLRGADSAERTLLQETRRAAHCLSSYLLPFLLKFLPQSPFFLLLLVLLFLLLLLLISFIPPPSPVRVLLSVKTTRTRCAVSHRMLKTVFTTTDLFYSSFQQSIDSFEFCNVFFLFFSEILQNNLLFIYASNLLCNSLLYLDNDRRSVIVIIYLIL